MKILSTIALVTALSAPLLAGDGILVVEKATVGAKSDTHRTQIEKNRMRAESTGPNGDRIVTIFDGIKQTLISVNMDRKTYAMATKADMDTFKKQSADAQARAQAQMAQMPPAQRAQMEAAMRGRGTAAASTAPKPQYRKIGTDKVGTWTCDKYEGILNNQKVAEVCTVDPKVFGFDPSDFEIGKRMAEFSGTAATAAPPFAAATIEAQGYAGVPVRQVRFVNGLPQLSFEIVQVTRQTFPDSSYEVPAGFQKVAGIGGR
jgi:hypothetical protein